MAVRLLGRSDRRAFAYDHDGEGVAAYAFTGGTLDEVRYTIRGESGNVLSDILRVDGVFTREADRVYMGRDEQVHIVYGAGGAVTYATAARDHLGSLRADVGGAEGGRVRVDLWPYGGQCRRRKIGTSSWDLHSGAHVFTGHERDYVGTGSGVDPTEGRDYMHARHYSLWNGRFLSVDSVDGEEGLSQSWNRYAYVRGNPVRALDPDGRQGLDGGLVRFEHEVATGERFENPPVDAADLARVGGTALHLVGDWTDPFQIGSATAEAVAAGESRGKVAMAVAKDAVRVAAAVGLVRASISAAGALPGFVARVTSGGSAAAAARIQRTVKAVKKFVGEDARAFHNEAGDLIIESKDGLRQFRVDLKNPHPHQRPHAHVSVSELSKGRKIRRIDERVFPRGKGGDAK